MSMFAKENGPRGFCESLAASHTLVTLHPAGCFTGLFRFT